MPSSIVAFHVSQPEPAGPIRSPAGTRTPVSSTAYCVADAMVSCDNTAHAFSATQFRFSCTGFSDGTSGGPLLADVSPADGLDTVIGVIGGYEQGGLTPQVSYSSRFGANVAALYRQAEADD